MTDREVEEAQGDGEKVIECSWGPGWEREALGWWAMHRPEEKDLPSKFKRTLKGVKQVGQLDLHVGNIMNVSVAGC